MWPGVSEAMNTAEDEYGEERLAQFLAANRNESVGQILENIYEDLRTFMGEATAGDDITVVVAKLT